MIHPKADENLVRSRSQKEDRIETCGAYALHYPAHLMLSTIAAAAISAFGSRETDRFLPNKPDRLDNVSLAGRPSSLKSWDSLGRSPFRKA